MRYDAINIGKKFGLLDEHWRPKVIAEMNDYQFKVAKLQGDFIWHSHEDTDESALLRTMCGFETLSAFPIVIDGIERDCQEQQRACPDVLKVSCHVKLI